MERDVDSRGGLPNVERAILSDGTAVHIRPIEAGDKEALRRGFERLSTESRYRRFLTPVVELGAAQLTYFTEIDHANHEALVAIEPDHGEFVGVARYVCLKEDPRTAEVAIAVADDWQGRGLGTLLVHELVDRARSAGVLRLSATCLADNSAVIDLLERLGPASVEHPEAGLAELVIELSPGQTPVDELRRTLREAAKGAIEVQPGHRAPMRA